MLKVRSFVCSVAVVQVLVIVGCSATISGGGGGRTFTVAEPLAGPVIVGRWMCIDDRNYDAMRQSNQGRIREIRCPILGGGLDDALEALSDGSGRTLRVHDDADRAPSGSFRIEGSELLYERRSELRWQYDEGTSELHIQTTGNFYGQVDILRSSENVIRFDRYRHRSGVNHLWFRIGSPEYVQFAKFVACVAENRGRNLFEVEDCGEPY